jgi:serine/threonine protein kinase
LPFLNFRKVDFLKDFPLKVVYLDVLGRSKINRANLFSQSQYKETGKQVTIKKLSHTFEHEILARRAIREILLLSEISHDNLISLVDIYTSEKDVQNLTYM